MTTKAPSQFGSGVRGHIQIQRMAHECVNAIQRTFPQPIRCLCLRFVLQLSSHSLTLTFFYTTHGIHLSRMSTTHSSDSPPCRVNDTASKIGMTAANLHTDLGTLEIGRLCDLHHPSHHFTPSPPLILSSSSSQLTFPLGR